MEMTISRMMGPLPYNNSETGRGPFPPATVSVTLFYVRRERRRFSVGAIPTRPLSLRPVALEAVEGGNDFD